MLSRFSKDYQTILRNVFACYLLIDLQRLEAAFAAGKVIRGAYVGPNDTGCVMNKLGGITSRSQLEAEFPPLAYGAPRALINAWDHGLLTERMIRKVLAEVIEERKLANSAEDLTVEFVRRRIQAKAAMMANAGV